MLKAIRRLFGLFALIALIFGALKSLFEWLDQNEHDSNEVFEDEEHDRISIALPAFVFAIGFVQSRKKFCLAFGFMGAFNFGKVGAITKVLTPEQRSADRKTALSLLGQALLLTAVIVAVTMAMPIK